MSKSSISKQTRLGMGMKGLTTNDKQLHTIPQHANDDAACLHCVGFQAVPKT